MTEPHPAAKPGSPALPRVSRSERFGYWLPWLVLALSLGATGGLWQAAKVSTEQEVHDYFDFRVREAVDKTAQRLTVYTEVLRGAEGLFRASANVNRNTFKAYVAALRLADDFPGIQGVGFSLLIPPSEKERHIAAIRKEGFPEYVIRPEGKRDIYTSIIYLEPFAERNLRAFGYDMYSEPVRRAAMERARDTGLPEMSGKVLLVQEATQNIQAGFLLYLPVYRGPHETPAQRRANIVGWVYAPFRMADLMHGIYGEHALDLDIHIYDGTDVSETSLMYDSSLLSGEKLVTHRYSTSQRLELAGHTWTLQIASRPSLDSRVNTERAKLIAAGGTATSLLLTLIIWILVHGRRRALLLAQQMNRELIASEQALRTSEGKLQAILDNADVAIGWADEAGTIEYLNRKFTELFGYAVADVPTIEQWYQRAYPDAAYRERIVAQWQAAVAKARQEGTAIAPQEIEVACKDGNRRWAVLNSAWVGSTILVSFNDITARKRYEETLQRWAHIFEYAEWGIIIGSADGQHIELMNPAFAKARGYGVEELMHVTIPELFVPEERAALDEHVRTAHETGHHTFEARHLRRDGSSFPVLVDVTAVKDTRGQVLYRVINVQDISQLKAAEKALQDSKAILQSILDNSPYMIWLKDTHGRFVAANRSFLDSTGRKNMNEVLGKTDADLWPEHLARKYAADDADVIASHRQKMTEEQALDKGRLIWMETFKTPVFDAYGNLLGVTGFSRDITERKLLEEKVLHQAQYDVLTELPNRILFSDRLLQAIAQARREKTHLAVMFLDLDRFKPVNDMFGHDIGDLLLREVAMRLESCVRQSDTVARIGGDEFCILLPSIAASQDAAPVAEKILQVLRQPFHPGGHTIYIASSIGIAIYPKDGRDEQTLIKNADIAMYWAKEAGRDNMQFFRPEMRDTELFRPDEED